MLALLAEEERIRAERRHRRPRQMWVRPWLLRWPVREADGRVGEGGKRGLQVMQCYKMSCGMNWLTLSMFY